MMNIQKNVQSATILTYALLLYSVLTLYFIPYGAFPYAKVFIPLLLVLFGFELLDKKITFGISEIILSIFIILFNIIPEFSITRFADALTIIVLVFKYRKFQYVNKIFLKVLYFLMLICIVYHACFSRYIYDDTTIIINNPDPNFSGFLALLFFLYCFKQRFVLGIIASFVLVFLLFSRNYLFSLILFFILLFLEKNLPNLYTIFFKRLGFIRICVLFMSINLAILINSFYFTENVDIVKTDFKRNNVNRFVTLNDDSNKARFTANKEFFELIKSDQNIALFGISREKMIEKSPDSTEENFDIKSMFPHRVPPHNSLFHMILMRGILFSTFYFLGIGLVIWHLYNQENLKYILPVILFTLFLHACYLGAFLIFILTIWALPEKDVIPIKVQSFKNNV